ncbi:hypothetical protein ARMGADRAFT_491211 [Armillaria gallica]|uniref:Uncharacterized protein n=1 Tax=Armillaria gallica TaxID=47427 RepID=A0A2H3E7L4_ARMGA|nr:hypothetical protein ARMGADRAFT_491211 [Armillaria gallica]
MTLFPNRALDNQLDFDARQQHGLAARQQRFAFPVFLCSPFSALISMSLILHKLRCRLPHLLLEEDVPGTDDMRFNGSYPWYYDALYLPGFLLDVFLSICGTSL